MTVRRAADHRVQKTDEVYFIECLLTGLVKIGRSQNTHSRLTALAAAGPGQIRLLTLLSFPLMGDLESQLHQRFVTERHHGEWFQHSGRVKRYVSVNRPDRPTRFHWLRLEIEKHSVPSWVPPVGQHRSSPPKNHLPSEAPAPTPSPATPPAMVAAHARKLIRLRDVTAKTGLSRSALYREISTQRFPAPVKIGARAIAFISHEVEDWISVRITARDRA